MSLEFAFDGDVPPTRRHSFWTGGSGGNAAGPHRQRLTFAAARAEAERHGFLTPPTEFDRAHVVRLIFWCDSEHSPIGVHPLHRPAD